MIPKPPRMPQWLWDLADDPLNGADEELYWADGWVEGWVACAKATRTEQLTLVCFCGQPHVSGVAHRSHECLPIGARQ